MERVLIDFHVHTRRSDGRLSPEEAVRRALEEGLDGIAITDHDVPVDPQLLKRLRREFPDAIIIPGVEVSTADGHLLVLGVTEGIPPGLPVEETIDRARELGGVVVVPHPFDTWRDGVGEDVLLRLTEPERKYDAIEGINGGAVRWGVNARALEFARKFGVPAVGGSDAHIPDQIGTVWTVVECVSTSVEDVLKSVKQGRVRPESDMTLPRHVKILLKRVLAKLRLV